jgi:hypothetical protein
VTRPADDTRLREAMRAMPHADPTDAQVAEVLRRARARQGAGRRVAMVVAIVLVALGALALPPGRSAVASAVGGLQDFFQGGATPGDGRPPIDIDVILDDVDPGTSRALVSQGGLRVIGYRQTGTGWPCIGLGSAVAECAAGDNWATKTAGHAIVALGATALDRSRDHVVWGIAERGVATVDVVDAAGRAVRATVGTNAFIAVLARERMPRTLVARDLTGLVLERIDVSGLRPSACRGGPCRPG